MTDSEQEADRREGAWRTPSHNREESRGNRNQQGSTKGDTSLSKLDPYNKK